MRSVSPAQPINDVAFIAIIVGALIMIKVVGVSPDALRAAAYLAAMIGAYRTGANRNGRRKPPPPRSSAA